MLILTRNIGKSLMVGDEISVTILGVKGNQVRLGVDAPKDCKVHREEIYLKILEEKGEPIPECLKDAISGCKKLKEELYSVDIQSGERYNGTVIKYFADKGFGFIESDIANIGIYFHISAVPTEPDINVGDAVRFDCDHNEKGLFATYVELSE